MKEEIQKIINRTEEMMDILSSRKAVFITQTWSNIELPQ